MPLFTVVLPTHDHPETLRDSAASVLSQSVDDLELFIVGDGATAHTAEVAAGLASQDRRVRYFDFPKGERHGERHRHSALAEAQGELVAYHGDDDLWLPDHLETLAEALRGVDLAHTMQIEVWPDGRTDWRLFNANHPEDRERLMRGQAGFGLNVGGHTLAAYRRLPRGWWPAPPRFPTDFHMWRQFVEQPWCRVAARHWPTAVHFSSASRHRVADIERGAEIQQWAQRLADPLELARLRRSVVAPMAAEWRGHAMHARSLGKAIAALHFPGALDPAAVTDAFPDCPLLLPHRRLRFGNSVAARGCPLSGFSVQEDWGVWSDGEAALLALPLAPLDTASHVLRIRLSVYLRAPAHPILNFRVACAGAEERSFATEQSEIEIDLPLPAIWAPLLLVHFTIENPMAPAALGESNDARRLGIGLIEAGLIPALPQLEGIP